MAPHGWATTDEREFLTSLIPDYEACQVKRRYKGFWQRVNAEFLNKFPIIDKLFPGHKIIDLTREQKDMHTAAVIKQQQRLKEWFRWQMNPRSRNAGTVITKKDLRNIYSGRSRPRKPYEVFAKLYPDDVEKEKAARCEAEGIAGRRMLNVWQDVSRELYLTASEEKKDAVKKALGDEDEEDMEDVETPAQYLRYLKKLPTLLDATITPAVQKAGVLALVTIVGPDPEQNGKIACKTLQFGDRPETPLFAEVWDGHDSIFIEELARFARRHEFSPEACLARALRKVATSTASSRSEDGDDPTPPPSPRVVSGLNPRIQSPTQGQGAEGEAEIQQAGVAIGPIPSLNEPFPRISIRDSNGGPIYPLDEVRPQVNAPSTTSYLPSPSVATPATTPAATSNDHIRPLFTSSTSADDHGPNSQGSRKRNLEEPMDLEGDEDGAEGEEHERGSKFGKDAWGFTDAHWDALDKTLVSINYESPGRLPRLPPVSHARNELFLPPTPRSDSARLFRKELALSEQGSSPVTASSIDSRSSYYTPSAYAFSSSASAFPLYHHSAPSTSINSTSINPPYNVFSPNPLPPFPGSHPPHTQIPSTPRNSRSPRSDTRSSSSGFIANFFSTSRSPDFSVREASRTGPLGSSLFASASSCIDTQPAAPSSPSPNIQQAPQSTHPPRRPFDNGNSMSTNHAVVRSNSGVRLPPIIPSPIRESPASSQRLSFFQPEPYCPAQKAPLALGASLAQNAQNAQNASPPQSSPPPQSAAPADTSPQASSGGSGILPSASDVNALEGASSGVPPTVASTLHAPTDNTLEGARRRSARGTIPSKRREQQQLIGTNASLTAGPDQTSEAAWFELALEHLRSFCLGEDWAMLVNKWAGLEAMMGYGKICKGGLSATGRPEEWQKWTSKTWQGTRRYDKIPQIDSAADLGVAFARWWLSLQPAFRESNGPFPLPVFASSDPTDSTDAWALLRKSGQNGFVSVLMLLGWWGHAATTMTSEWEDDSREAWRHITLDMLSVVDAMTTTLQVQAPSVSKRVSSKENIAPARRAPKRRKQS